MNTEAEAEQNTELTRRPAWPGTPRPIDVEPLVSDEVEDQGLSCSQTIRGAGSAAARAGEGFWRRIVASPAKVSAAVRWAWRTHPGRVMLAALCLVALASAGAVVGIVSQGANNSPVTSTCSEVG